MALIKCSECQREVSDRATNCPGCGAPIVTPASGDTSPNLVMIEKTSKKWKKNILVSLCTLSAGIVLALIGGAAAGPTLDDGGFSVMLIGLGVGIIGIFGFVWSVVMAWWHHG